MGADQAPEIGWRTQRDRALHCHHADSRLHSVRHRTRPLRHCLGRARHCRRVSFRKATTAKTRRSRLQRQIPGAAEAARPPQHIASVIGDIVALMQGERRDFNYVALDLGDIPEFNRKVCDDRPHHSAGPDADLRRDRDAARRQVAVARCRHGARAKSVSDRGAVPSRAGGERQDRRLLRAGRRRHQAASCSRSSAPSPAGRLCSTICRSPRAGSANAIIDAARGVM